MKIPALSVTPIVRSSGFVTVIALDQLSVHFSNTPVFDSFSLTLRRGDRVGIAGASGSGKTTLLTVVAGLANPAASVRGKSTITGRIGYIPQEATHSLSPFLRVLDQAAEFAPSRELARGLLTRLGLDDRRQQSFPHQLSGGERQRVLIAQALALNPDVILADEPTANLDETTETVALAAIDDYAKRNGAALLIASHHEDVFARLNCQVHRLTPAVDRALPSPLSASGETLLRIEHVSKTYSHRDFLLRANSTIQALRDVTFEIRSGETLALLGPSGSGKTTLARCLARREAPDSGTISPPDVRVQLVQQEPSQSLNPRWTVARALHEVCEDFAPSVLKAVDLNPSWIDRPVTALSEGQRARIAIVRTAQAARGGLLILDESLAGLDTESISAVASFLQDMQRRTGMACLLITHRRSLATSLAHRILSVREGRLV